MTEETLFFQGLAKPVGERTAFLDAACVGQPDLRAAVEALLAAHETPGSFLDRPPRELGESEAADAAAKNGSAGRYTPELNDSLRRAGGTAYRSDVDSGFVIAGRYTLVELIGEGGMGEVWVAKQTEPIKRRVALKLIKAGMDTTSVLHRFDAERHVLALMDHPNISRVLDGGVTADRRPYFVMELVNGLVLTKFCDEAKLTPRQRLELFVPICQAVQHAHQKGIVHRDLKPSNILVTLIDGKPVPKIIDFGVAKATGGSLTEESLATQFGAVVGTLEYMAPEQAGFSGADIDTRADIYSLGVILYELLTGLRPIEIKRARKATFVEMVRMIQEEEPTKPSTRLSTDDRLPSLAATRQVEPKRLMAMLRGELDWVVMKCLEKSRDRRYQTAAGLARDVQRFLADEPVEARPPSVGYRTGKFLRRHKGPVAAALLVLLALLGGIAGTTWGMLREAERAAGERQAKQEAVAAAQAEAKANAEAQKRLRQVENGSAILMSVFSDLNPRAEEREVKPLRALLGDRLAQAAEQLDGDAVGDPQLVADLQTSLGRSLLGLDYADRAIPLFLKARATQMSELGADHYKTLASANDLASGYKAAGKLDQALPLYEETLRLRKAALGADHPHTLKSMNNLAAAYQAAGRHQQALELFEVVLSIRKAAQGVDHFETLQGMANLAAAYQAAGKSDQALPLMAEAMRLMKAKMGADHPDTLHSVNNLATALQSAGKLDQAVPLLEETLAQRKVKLGPDHRDTLLSMNNLASAYRAAGRLDQALPLFQDAFRIMTIKLGSDHPSTLLCMGNLALAYQAAGKLNLALPLLEESLKQRKAKLGADHPSTLIALNNLAMAYQAARKLDQAVPIYEETLRARRATLGADHPDTLLSMNNLAWGYQATGHVNKALPLFREAAEGLDRRRFQHQFAGRIVNNLVECLESGEGGRLFAEAEGWRRKWLTVVAGRAGKDSLPYAAELGVLGANLLSQKKWADAESVLRSARAVAETKAPDAWMTFNISSMLGEALLGQKNYVEAEPLLLAGYEGMKSLGSRSPAQGKPRRLEGIDCLIQLCDALERTDEAAMWRAELKATEKALKRSEKRPQ